MARGWGNLRNSTVLIRISIVLGVVFGEFQPLVTLFDVSYFQVLFVHHLRLDAHLLPIPLADGIVTSCQTAKCLNVSTLCTGLKLSLGDCVIGAISR